MQQQQQQRWQQLPLRRFTLSLLLLFLVTDGATTARQADASCTVRVNGESGSDSSGCGTTGNSACRTVSYALQAAASNNAGATAVTLCLEPAVYTGPGNTNISLLPRASETAAGVSTAAASSLSNVSVVGVASSSLLHVGTTIGDTQSASDRAGPGRALVDCRGLTRGWYFEDPSSSSTSPIGLLISGVDFHNCKTGVGSSSDIRGAGAAGGALRFVGWHLALNDVHISSCRSATVGGAVSANLLVAEGVYPSAPSVAVANSSFTSCSAEIAGGGVSITSEAPSFAGEGILVQLNGSTTPSPTTVSLVGTTFADNSVNGVADPHGGGLAVNCSISGVAAGLSTNTVGFCEIQFTESVFERNTILSALEMGSARGGGIYVGGAGAQALGPGSRMSLEAVLLVNNSVTVTGPGQSAGDVEADGGALAFDGHTFVSFTANACNVTGNAVHSKVLVGAVEPIMMRGGAISITSPTVPTGGFSNDTSLPGRFDSVDPVNRSRVAGVVFEDCLFENNSLSLTFDTVLDVEVFGAAVYSSANSLRFTNCNFTSNTNSAGSGGAVALIGGRSETTFEACNFVQNSAETTAASHGLGGAVFAADLSLCTFRANCTFRGNTASPSSRQGGGGTIDPSAGAGGALAVVNSGVVCDGCIFLSNKVEADSRSDMVDGGGVYIVTSSSFRDPAKDMWVKELIRRRYGDEISSFVGPSPSLFVNCTFDGNLAGVPADDPESSGAGQGGAVSAKSSSPVFKQCTFSNNEAWSNLATNAVGGAVSVDAIGGMDLVILSYAMPSATTPSPATPNISIRPKPQFANCTFTHNVVRSTFAATAAGSVCGCGGAMYMNNVELIVNSTVWSSNFVACPNPSPEGQIFGAGGALFMDAAGSIVASGNLFQGNGVEGAKEVGTSIYIAQATSVGAAHHVFDNCTFVASMIAGVDREAFSSSSTVEITTVNPASRVADLGVAAADEPCNDGPVDILLSCGTNMSLERSTMVNSPRIFAGDCNSRNVSTFPADATALLINATQGAQVCAVETEVTVVGNSSFDGLRLHGIVSTSGHSRLIVDHSSEHIFSTGRLQDVGAFLVNTSLDCSRMKSAFQVRDERQGPGNQDMKDVELHIRVPFNLAGAITMDTCALMLHNETTFTGVNYWGGPADFAASYLILDNDASLTILENGELSVVPDASCPTCPTDTRFVAGVSTVSSFVTNEGRMNIPGVRALSFWGVAFRQSATGMLRVSLNTESTNWYFPALVLAQSPTMINGTFLEINLDTGLKVARQDRFSVVLSTDEIALDKQDYDELYPGGDVWFCLNFSEWMSTPPSYEIAVVPRKIGCSRRGAPTSPHTSFNRNAQLGSQLLDLTVAPWSKKSNSSTPPVFAELLAAVVEPLFHDVKSKAVALQLALEFGGYGFPNASVRDATLGISDREADNELDPSPLDCQYCLDGEDPNITCRWIVTDSDVALGHCADISDPACTSPSAVNSPNSSLRLFSTDSLPTPTKALNSFAPQTSCLTVCCAANCNSHGTCTGMDSCQCDVLHTGPQCERINWIFVLATGGTALILIAVAVFVWVRRTMSQRARRPRLNSATEHLLLNPAAGETMGGDFASEAGGHLTQGLTEEEASKLTKLRQDLHLKALEIDFSELKLRDKIGQGAFGVVYSAFYRGSKVAVKMVQSFANDRATALEEQRAIRKEALLMTQLKHPNIVLTMGVTIKEADEFDPQMLCIVTEFTSRGSLYDVLHDMTVTLDFDRILGFAVDAATGMVFLHRHPPPILHHDLKSSNLLVDDKWTVKVCDFGNSRFCQANPSPHGSAQDLVRSRANSLGPVPPSRARSSSASRGRTALHGTGGDVKNLLRTPTKSRPITPRREGKESWPASRLSRSTPTAGFHRGDNSPVTRVNPSPTVQSRHDFSPAVASQSQHGADASGIAPTSGLFVSTHKGTTPWLAPELLREDHGQMEYPTVAQMLSIDVYSFGIVMWEMATRRQPFLEFSRSKFAIEAAVRSGKRPGDADGGKLIFAPSSSTQAHMGRDDSGGGGADPRLGLQPNGVEASRLSAQHLEYAALMAECWDGDPAVRPSFGEVLRRLRRTQAAALRNRKRGSQGDGSRRRTQSERVLSPSKPPLASSWRASPRRD